MQSLLCPKCGTSYLGEPYGFSRGEQCLDMPNGSPCNGTLIEGNRHEWRQDQASRLEAPESDQEELSAIVAVLDAAKDWHR